MPVPSLITDLTTVAATNSPAGTESAKGTVDNYFRAHASFIKQIYDQTLGPTVSVASAATTNIGFAASANVLINGTTTITAFDTYAEGTLRYAVFSGALTLTHNATSLILPGGANIVTAAGDIALFKSLGAGNWKCMFYTRVAGSPAAYLPLTGGSMSGSITFDNTKGISMRDSGGTPYSFLNVGADNMVNLYNSGGQSTRLYNQAGSLVLMSVTNTGTLSAIVVTQTSDERKKRNWNPLTDAQLDALAKMERSGTFEWIEDGEASVGGSAQEIQAIVPEAIITDSHGNLSVNYGGLNFAILQAMLRRGAK